MNEKFSLTSFYKNYELYDKIVGNASMRSTIDGLMYWKFFQFYKFNKILEIGVYQGQSTGLLLELNNPSLYIGIDIKLRLDLFYKLYPNNAACKFIEDASERVNITDTFDLILIDGDHSYSAALTDINKSITCIDKSGVIIIDDFDYPGVHQAIIDSNLTKCGFVPFVQLEQSELWHHQSIDRTNFLDSIITDTISNFVFLYNITRMGSTVLKAKTLTTLTNEIDIFKLIISRYDL